MLSVIMLSVIKPCVVMLSVVMVNVVVLNVVAPPAIEQMKNLGKNYATFSKLDRLREV
jgi:hypothetical protein